VRWLRGFLALWGPPTKNPPNFDPLAQFRVSAALPDFDEYAVGGSRFFLRPGPHLGTNKSAIDGDPALPGFGPMTRLDCFRPRFGHYRPRRLCGVRFKGSFAYWPRPLVRPYFLPHSRTGAGFTLRLAVLHGPLFPPCPFGGQSETVVPRVDKFFFIGCVIFIIFILVLFDCVVFECLFVFFFFLFCVCGCFFLFFSFFITCPLPRLPRRPTPTLMICLLGVEPPMILCMPCFILLSHTHSSTFLETSSLAPCILVSLPRFMPGFLRVP